MDMIRLYLTDEEVYDHYFEFSYNKKLSSPYRYDPSPSLSYKKMEDGTVIWKDFGDPDQKHFDPPGLLMKLFDCTYSEACEKIWKELVLERESDFEELDPDRFSKTNYVLQSRYAFEFFDDESFIGKYMEDLVGEEFVDRMVEVMKLAKVRPVKTVYFDGKPKWEWSDDNPIYHYKIGEYGWKMYRPLDISHKKRDKWRSENIYGELECLGLANGESRVLIITKSTKDCLLLKLIGYDCMAPTSENAASGIKKYLSDMYDDYDYIFILFDNDEAGIKSSKKLMKRFNRMIDATFTLSKDLEDEKDCSDFADKYDIKSLKQIVDAYVNYMIETIKNK